MGRDVFCHLLSFIPNRKGNWKNVKLVCKKWNHLGDCVFDPSENDNHAIRWASRNGRVDAVKKLLSDRRVDPSVRNNYPIRKASVRGHAGVIQLLLCDPRVDPCEWNNYAIQLASSEGHIEAVRMLLSDHRVDPSVDSNWAIRKASEYGHAEVVRELLRDKRVDPSVWKDHPIRLASIYGRVYVVKELLLDPRVDPSHGDNFAIRLASEYGYTEVIVRRRREVEIGTIMYVLKRNGTKEPVYFDKITTRIQNLCELDPPLDTKYVDPVLVSQKVIQGIFPGVKTSELDNLAAETCAYMSTVHPGYGELAARIAISNLHKLTPSSFSEVMEMEKNYVNPKTGQPSPLLSDECFSVIMKNKDLLDSTIVHERDYQYDYFGFKTLERSYLVKLNNKIVERPQYMLMRVAIGIHKGDIDAAIETYHLMSTKFFTHATPTLFNAGTPCPQMSSCYLLTMTEDSIFGIYETLKRCALISKSAGGIGLAIHNIRASNSYIRGTNGTSNGLVPMLRVFNDTARYVDQGGGKRKGAFAVYLEPWHADIFEFLDLKKNTGKEEQRARDLFFALWIPDLFMKRVEANGEWSLFCPNEAPGLHDCWGEEFEKLYLKYESTPGLARKKIKAQELWFAIVESQVETGTPYMLYKDSCNGKSNQQNLGTIKCSNLCTEVVEYTAPDEVACCNLSSIALPKFVIDGKFDHHKLYEITKVIARNLNKIIDGNYYPIEEARRSNLRHRPIGIGIQGLADVFIMMRLPWESEGATRLNRDIFETIYFAALTASMELAKVEGPYSTYEGSPVSKGILQFDMWGVSPSDRWDWNGLKEEIKKYGVRNSLLLAPMPTASTSQILGNNECFEAYTSNIYTRRVLAGEFAVVNKYLVSDLMELGLWNKEMKDMIIHYNGSIQKIQEIPSELKSIYKTVWEISQKVFINMAADRGAFIDQSQSFNVFIGEPNFEKVTSMHFYAWKKGLKTGMYYLRSKPAVDAIKFTIDQTAIQKSISTVNNNSNNDQKKSKEDEPLFCTKESGCLTCGS